MRLSKLLTALTLAAATTLLAACQGVPNEGAVEIGLSDLQRTQEQVVFDPSGPLPGATQEEVLRGFLAAASSAANDYGVAREFLAPGYADTWEPSNGALIDEGTRPFEQVSEQVAEITVTEVASVDSRGVLTSAASQAQTTELRFEFSRVNGEWRISSAPVSVVLDRTMFSAVWMQVALQYPNATGALFADQRWFVNDSNLIGNVVSELLFGPAAAFTVAYHDAVPNTITLTKPATVEDGKLQLTLSNEFAELQAANIDLFTEQLNATIAPLGVLDSYEIITSNRGVIRSGNFVSTSTDTVGDAPYILQDGKFGELRGSSTAASTPLTTRVANLEPLSAMVNAAGDRAAVLSATGAWLVTEGRAEQVDSRRDLLSPALDSWGYVWTAAPTVDSEIIVSGSGSGNKHFQLPAVELDGLREIRVSPDGNLLAMLVTRNSQTSVLISGIKRNADGLPVQLDQAAYLVLSQTGTAADLDWIDGSRFAVLTKVSEAAKVTVGGVGTLKTERGAVTGGIAIAASDTNRGLRVLDSNGNLLRSQGGSTWTQVASGISLLAKRTQ